ncbi:MAG: DUF2147 domain-containing protein [Cyclobacteriaceae bacterium]
MKALFLTLIVGLITSYSSSGQSITGKWKTIDDETGKPRSIVEVYEKEGEVFGKIIELFREPDEDPDPICEECTDYRKDKKVIGMEIISDMKAKGEEYVDGEILDPENGKIYKCKLWVEEGNLKVRGYLYFLYRTQTWLPVGE